MKIKFLGTGAADWCLALKDGKQIERKYSSALIDGELLIDPGHDAVKALQEYGIPAENVKYILNTHDHDDHMDREVLGILTEAGAVFTEVTEAQTFTLGRYTIEAVKANHAIDCVHFLISDGSSKLFYALDGAWITYEEAEAVKKEKVDLAVFDATIGFVDGDYRIFEHNNLNMVIEMKKTLAEHIDRFFISHMAYTLHDDHQKLVDDMAEYGIEVAYDGLETEF